MIRHVLAGALFIAALAFMQCGCGGPAAAESLYTSQQLACVDLAKTREEADACRARVRAEWATSDAGGDR